MSEEKEWKKEFNIVHQTGKYFIHQMKNGNYQLIDENTYMAIIFDSVEWCCPFDNWTLFLDNVWVGCVSIDEGDQFLERLDDERQEYLIKNAPPKVEGAKVEGTVGGVGGQQTEIEICPKCCNPVCAKILPDIFLCENEHRWNRWTGDLIEV